MQGEGWPRSQNKMSQTKREIENSLRHYVRKKEGKGFILFAQRERESECESKINRGVNIESSRE